MKIIIRIFSILFLISFLNYKVTLADTLPDINGKAAITVDASTGELIYTKNIDGKMFPASTTKLMTAIILAEHAKPEDLFTYSEEASTQESFTVTADVIHLPINDKISAADAMDAMLLCSGNDIAYMVGQNIGGGNINYFVYLMNKKAAELGLRNTNFITVNGLHNENHYSTAYDLSILARELYKYPWIMSTLQKKEGKLTTSSGVVATFKNTNKLLSEAGCIGGKTGYTSEAMRCLVTLYNINGREIVGVVLKSDMNDADTIVFSDMKKIIDWSYATSKTTLLKKDTELKKISLSYHLLPFNLGPTRTIDIPIYLNKNVDIYQCDDTYNLSYELIQSNPWKINTATNLGKVIIKGREFSNSIELYTTFNRNILFLINLPFYMEYFFTCVGFIVLFILICFVIQKVTY